MSNKLSHITVRVDLPVERQIADRLGGFRHVCMQDGLTKKRCIRCDDAFDVLDQPLGDPDRDSDGDADGYSDGNADRDADAHPAL